MLHHLWLNEALENNTLSYLDRLESSHLDVLFTALNEANREEYPEAPAIENFSSAIATLVTCLDSAAIDMTRDGLLPEQVSSRDFTKKVAEIAFESNPERLEKVTQQLEPAGPQAGFAQRVRSNQPQGIPHEGPG